MALLQKAYLGATPLFRNTAWFEDDDYTVINESSTVTVTANSSAHTKGAWSELIASTSANASLLSVECTAFASATDTSTLLDIGTGASGSESVLVANIGIGGALTGRASANATFMFEVPVQVPSGTRLSARIQSVVTGGKTADIAIRVIAKGDYAQAPTSVDTIGADTANSTGTLMSGASGTWVEITSSTSQAYRAIVVIPSLSTNAAGNAQLKYILGTGASGSEAEIGRVEWATNNTEIAAIYPAYPTLIANEIPSGTRLSIKHDAASGPNRYGVTLIGIP